MDHFFLCFKFFIYILDGKNHMLPTGELLVYNITKHDAQKTYRCRTHHRLTQTTIISKNSGKIQLTGMFLARIAKF